LLPSAEKALEVFHGLIIDAAAAMDEGMETCSGDILGDEEEVEQVNMAMDMGGSSVPGGGLVSPLLMGAPSPLHHPPHHHRWSSPY